MNIQIDITTAADSPCLDPAWLCWVEAHPGLAGWLQIAGVLATILIALLSPIWAEFLTDRKLRRVAVIRTVNALARAVGSADAFVQGADGWGDDPAFDNAFPKQTFEAAMADLRLAEQDMPHLGQAGPRLATFTMGFAGFIDLTQQITAARNAEQLGGYVRFMTARRESLEEGRREILRLLKIDDYDKDG